ncbi:MAG: diguanylate cyclase, partial [Myxococcales bacterium]|nr:diguanylate cyclase [Myxococcales bacterium]
MRAPIVVAVIVPEDVAAPALGEPFRVVRAAPEEVVPDAAVRLLDRRAFASVDAMLSSGAGSIQPALYRVDARSLNATIAGLRACDDVLLSHDAPALIAHRLRAAVGRRARDRDELTGALTRPAYTLRLDRALVDASPDRPVQVALLDIDHFKAINDVYGHDRGDRILRELAARLGALPGPIHAIGRYGGEEFIVVAEVRDDDAARFAEGLCALVRDAPFADPLRIAVTVSVGAATTVRPISSAELCARADQALYAAKAHGRDRAITWTELEREALRSHGDLRLIAFENMTRVVSGRVAEIIARRGRRMLEELRSEADLDGLTGLFSRAYFDRRAPYECAEADHAGAPFTLALLDVDFFGAVNKDHGWPTGDRVLQEIARRVRSQVRSTDWVARYGGEE